MAIVVVFFLLKFLFILAFEKELKLQSITLISLAGTLGESSPISPLAKANKLVVLFLA